jgi:hypothetical protein
VRIRRAIRHSYPLLPGPENLTPNQEVKLSDLLRYNLKAIRSYLLKEDFQFFWAYVRPYYAGVFLDRWCKRTMLSKIEPMKKVARNVAVSSRAFAELVSSQRHDFKRSDGGSQ